MSFLKNLGDKAKVAATAVGSKSQEMVEIGKLKMNISSLEGDIKKLKLEIGELVYDAFAKSEGFPLELIEKINNDIQGKFTEIQAIQENIANIQANEQPPQE